MLVPCLDQHERTGGRSGIFIVKAQPARHPNSQAFRRPDVWTARQLFLVYQEDYSAHTELTHRFVLVYYFPCSFTEVLRQPDWYTLRQSDVWTARQLLSFSLLTLPLAVRTLV